MCPGVPTRVGVVQWSGPDNAGIERKSIDPEGNPHGPGVLIGCAQILAARRFRRNFGAVGALDAKWASSTTKARRHDPPGPRQVKRG